MVPPVINYLPVRDISLNSLNTTSVQLAKLVEQGGFIPEHVLFVERAGLLIGYEVARYFKCPISGVATKRSGGSAKSNLKLVLRYLPRFLTHLLRRIEISSSVHDVKSERRISYDYKLPDKFKRILLVDDAIDTGHSMLAVMNFLEKRGYSCTNIRVAVITTTAPKPKYVADYSLFSQVICAFPWSYDSRQYHEAWALYDEKKKILCK